MFFATDFIINGEGQGPVASLVQGVRADMGLLRPFWDERGIPTVTANTGRRRKVRVKNKKTGVEFVRMEQVFEDIPIKNLRDIGVEFPVHNATSMTRDQWMQFDQRLIPPSRNRLRFYNDVAAVETKTFDGLGTLLIEHETMSDPGKAYMDMYGLSEGTTDTPLLQPEAQNVPICHASFTYDRRRLEASRNNGGVGLNTRGIDWATRRVMELVEDTSVGVAGDPVEWGESPRTTGYTRAPATYGALNFPDRLTKTDMTIPTGSNPEAVLADFLEARDLLYGANHYGPYGIYHSTDYDRYLDDDYARLGGNNANMTLRQRILAIGTEGGEVDSQKQIRFVKRLDRLTPANSHAFTSIMVSLNPEVVRALNGMPVTVFQYETKGGWEIHYKVACIMLTEWFADYYGNCGLLHMRTA